MLFIGTGQSGKLSTVALCGWRRPLSGPNTTTLQPFVSPLNGTFHYRQAQKQLQKIRRIHEKRILCSLTQEDDSDWHFDLGRRKRPLFPTVCFKELILHRSRSRCLIIFLTRCQRRLWRTTCHVLTAGRASDGATNPSGRTHERGEMDGGEDGGGRGGLTEQSGESRRQSESRSRVSDEGWRLALGDRLYVTGPKLCHGQEVDQKETDREGEGGSSKAWDTFLKEGHDSWWHVTVRKAKRSGTGNTHWLTKAFEAVKRRQICCTLLKVVASLIFLDWIDIFPFCFIVKHQHSPLNWLINNNDFIWCYVSKITVCN